MKRRVAPVVAVLAVVVLIAALAPAAMVAFLLARATATAESALPAFETVRSAHRPSDILAMDRHGRPIAELRVDFSERRGQWVPIEAISPALRHAVLLSEDRRFDDHGGVDWLAVAVAAHGWIFGEGRRGASTISMQLAAMLDPSLRRPRSGRGLEQKWHQMQRALQLEAAWSKSEILEAYLNLTAFRGELRGIDAVSRVMFGKHPHGLAQREAAVAAALLRGPNSGLPSVTRRACALLNAPDTSQACRGLAQEVGQWLAATARPAVDAPMAAMHFARYALTLAERTGGENVEPGTLQTTLDADLQTTVTRSVARHLAGMGETHLTDAAVVVLDNRSGEVLAYVGSSAESTAGDVDHVRARRQAGSTLKPFLYALVLEQQYLTPASLLNDAPLDVATSGGLYVPGNYDSTYAGLVSVRTALASSLNIPAVRTLMLVGTERFADRLRLLGLPLVHEADHYGLSLSLGSADVDLLSLTNAYRSLAQGVTVATPLTLLKGQEQAEIAMPGSLGAPAGWVVGDILSDRRARARTFGLESPLSTRFWTAVKTGTSKDMRDNWTIGWSSHYTVGVWVGNSQGLSMREVSGVSGAAPIWHEVMSYLHADLASHQPPPPERLERVHVHFEGVREADRTEYFLPGTAIAHVRPAQAAGGLRPRILAPTAGTVVALDPDMPAAVQRLTLRASGEPLSGSLDWRVGGQIVGHGPSTHWAPSPGRHTIMLIDKQGRKLDEIIIQVRGLPRATAQPLLNDAVQIGTESTSGLEIAGPLPAETAENDPGPTHAPVTISGIIDD